MPSGSACSWTGFWLGRLASSAVSQNSGLMDKTGHNAHSVRGKSKALDSRAFLPWCTRCCRNASIQAAATYTPSGPWRDRVLHESWAAIHLVRNLARRIGVMQRGDPLPRALSQQRWSPFNVPLMWAAAGNDPSHPVLDWLVEHRVREPVEFHRGHTTTAEAARERWQALRTAMRSWGIRSHHDLSAWFGGQGFPRVSPATTSLPGHKNSCWAKRSQSTQRQLC